MVWVARENCSSIKSIRLGVFAMARFWQLLRISFGVDWSPVWGTVRKKDYPEHGGLLRGCFFQMESGVPLRRPPLQASPPDAGTATAPLKPTSLLWVSVPIKYLTSLVSANRSKFANAPQCLSVSLWPHAKWWEAGPVTPVKSRNAFVVETNRTPNTCSRMRLRWVSHSACQLESVIDSRGVLKEGNRD